MAEIIKHIPSGNRMADLSALAERREIVAWLREDRTWMQVCCGTMAQSNSDMLHACEWLSRAIENGAHLAKRDTHP
jgi:hypothetical protein